MITGRCLCEGVRFEISGEIGSPSLCHCSLCRHASGSAFAVNAGVASAAFRVTAGPDLIREYESSPGHFRAFCSRCGSPLYSRMHAHPDFRRIRPRGCLRTETRETAVRLFCFSHRSASHPSICGNDKSMTITSG